MPKRRENMEADGRRGTVTEPPVDSGSAGGLSSPTTAENCKDRLYRSVHNIFTLRFHVGRRYFKITGWHTWELAETVKKHLGDINQCWHMHDLERRVYGVKHGEKWAGPPYAVAPPLEYENISPSDA